MKSTYKIFLIFLMILQGCDKWIDPGINENPNEPSDVTMEALVSFIEADVAFKIGGGIELIAYQSIFLQQLDGVDRAMLGVSNYTLGPQDEFLVWEDAYAEILMDTKVLGDKADKLGSPHNSGVADIMTAITLGQLTDAWDKIPWSEALQGDKITQPVYDEQESIYLSIQNLLDRAIDSLSVASDPYGIKGDYYYKGDPVKWIKAAHALKARYAIHLSNRKGEQAYVVALSQAGMAFASNDDDMQFEYGTGESESNPLYQFMRDRDDARMGAFFVDLLKIAEDPRLAVYAAPDQDGNYSGSAPGQANGQASRPGPAVAAPDAPTCLITYTEVLFIQAEALLKTGGDEVMVRTILMNAVRSSLDKYGVTDEYWIADYNEKVNALTGDDLFKEIMTQKYIATFYQPEVFHSWRRTGIPVITPNPAGATDEIPRRFPYPPAEIVYNSNVPTGISVTDHVWWD
jgi:hypothetical protein